MGWLVTLRDGTAAWLPLLFAVMLMAMLYVLWRTLEVMPRVTAAKTISIDAAPAGLPLLEGRACLAVHRHAPDFTWQRNMQVRGALTRSGDGWNLVPRRPSPQPSRPVRRRLGRARSRRGPCAG